MARYYIQQNEGAYYVWRVDSEDNRRGLFGMPQETDRYPVTIGLPEHRALEVLESLQPGSLFERVIAQYNIEEHHELCGYFDDDFNRMMAPPSITDAEGRGIYPSLCDSPVPTRGEI